LILDEPTTGIDRSGQKQFVESIRQIKSELALTVVLVTHDLRAVADLSDRVACLNVTLHYHDAPQSLPAELAAEWFGTTVFK
jgi:zinc transport system ATP-binding protein